MVSEEIIFEELFLFFLFILDSKATNEIEQWTVLGQRLNNDLDLLYSQIFLLLNQDNTYYQFLGQIFKTFHEILCISILPLGLTVK